MAYSEKQQKDIEEAKAKIHEMIDESSEILVISVANVTDLGHHIMVESSCAFVGNPKHLYEPLTDLILSYGHASKVMAMLLGKSLAKNDDGSKSV